MSADSSDTPTPEESGAGTPDDGASGNAPAPQPLSDTAGHWIPPSLEHLQALLPNYEFLEILGHGGMGAVYKARQLSLDRLVAIKILPPGIAVARDHSFVERFKNEARTMAKMNHPGIVNVYDFGQTAEGQLYLVMEYIDGTDVAKMVHSQGRLPPEYALAIAAHVCDALQYAHTHGVIHRDIKPANVLINMEGQVKVADFGLAKAKTRGAQTTALTDTNITMGTPDYVAPEALVMGMEPDHRADLYALGVMLYNMLTGEIPRGRFKSVSEKTGGDPRFDIIINKAMQERDARYQTALNMRRDLDVILTVPLAKSDATSSAIPKQVAQQNAVRKPVARRPSPVHAPSPPPPKKSGAPVGIIVLVLLVVGGFFAWQQFNKRSPAPTDSSGTTTETALPASLNPSPNPIPSSTPQPNAPAAIADEAGFAPLFGADGIRDWNQHTGAKWDFSGGVLSCHMSTKHTARMRCPKDFAPANFEIRFAVRGDRGPAFEFRGNAGDMSDSYVFDPAASRTGGKTFWDEKKQIAFARPGQRVCIRHDDQREELPKLAALPKWKDGDWNEVTLTVQGNHFSSTCNGVLAAEITDDSPSYRAGPGEFGFRLTNGPDGELSAEFKDIRIRRLPAGTAASANTVVAGTTGGSYPQPPAWSDCTQILRTSSDKIAVDGDWLYTTAKVQMPNLAPGKTFRNPIVRVRYSGRVDIALRREHIGGEDVRYEAGIGTAGATLELTQVNGGRLAPAVKLGPSYQPTDEHQAVFAAQGSTVSLWIDGRNVTAVQDSALSSGGIAILLKNDSNGNCHIKQVEYGELPDAAATKGNPASPAASGPHDAPMDTSWKDVLPLVQLPRDLSEEKPTEGAAPQAAADWRLDDGVLSATKGGNHAIISPDLALPGSYDLSLHVKASSGKNSSAGVIVPVGGHHMMVFFQLFNFEMSGLEVIDGKNVPPGGLTTIRPAVIHENVEQLVEISVRSHSGDASVALKVDGKPVVDWAGKEASVSLFWQWSGRVKPHRLGLCADVAGATVRDVRVRRAEDGVIATPVVYGDMRVFKGHSYQMVFERALSWTDAKMKAEKMGGHLATITSKEEDDWIIASFGQVLKTGRMGASFWLGASQATTKSDWQWVTGEPFKFTNWGHGEPNATLGEGAPIGLAYAYGAEIYKGGVGWNDIPPHSNAAWGPEASMGYLVEWDTAPVAAAAPKSPPAPAEKWTDWLAEQRRGGKLPPGLVEDGNGYKVTSPKFLAAVGPVMKDGAIRITGSRRSAQSLHLLLRCVNPNPNYYKKAGLNSYAKTYRLQDWNKGVRVEYREASASGGVMIGDLASPTDSSKNHPMELRMVGNVLTATYDGKQLLNTRETRITEGQPGIYAEAGAYFEKIEVLDLDGPRLPPTLLARYIAALKSRREGAPPIEKAAYESELARLNSDPTLPLVDAPGTPAALLELRKIARGLLGGR